MKKRLRKHLFDYLCDLEFAIQRFAKANGVNRDFHRMTPQERSDWLLFLQAVQEQTRYYQSWLMHNHLASDPKGEQLERLPRPVAAKLRALKNRIETLKAAANTNQQ